MVLCQRPLVTLFPSLCVGDHACAEGETTSFSRDELSGVAAATVPQTGDSSISISFVPDSLLHADERLAIVTDFKLTLEDATALYVY